MPVTRSSAGTGGGCPDSGRCRSTGRSAPTRPSRSTIATPWSARSGACRPSIGPSSSCTTTRASRLASIAEVAGVPARNRQVPAPLRHPDPCARRLALTAGSIPRRHDRHERTARPRRDHRLLARGRPAAASESTKRAIAVTTRTIRQSRRPSWMPWRSPNVNGLMRVTLAATAVVAVAVGALYLTGANRNPSPPAAGQGSASPSPIASPSAASPVISPVPRLPGLIAFSRVNARQRNHHGRGP